jgi:hypothetical protein
MNERQYKPVNYSKLGAPVRSASQEEVASLKARLVAKADWKKEAGHRYTPAELKRMSEATDVKIYRRKRIVMRLV